MKARRREFKGKSMAPAIASAVLLLVSFAALLLAPSPAGAADEGTPAIEAFELKQAFATRAVFLELIPPQYGGIQWRLEYKPHNAASWQPGLSSTRGMGRAARAELSQLQTSTLYDARLVVSASLGTVERMLEFETTPVSAPLFFAPHAAIFEEELGSACEGNHLRRGVFCQVGPDPGPHGYSLSTGVYANGADSSYSFQYSTSRSELEAGNGTSLAAAAGNLTALEEAKVVNLQFEGLQPETTYWLWGTVENQAGTSRSEPISFTTHYAHPGSRLAGGEIEHDATSANLLGFIDPNDSETSWRFEYAKSISGPWTPATEGTVPAAESAYPADLKVVGTLSGLAPATTYFVRLAAENEAGSATSEIKSFTTSGPPSAVTFLLHSLDGEAIRLLGYLQPNNDGLGARSYPTHYWFEYLPQELFQADGETFGAGTESTARSEFDGTGAASVGIDLPAVEPNRTYVYRLAATNTTPGNPIAYGQSQLLSVPGRPAPSSVGPCPNASLRTGPSASLPDCRAYEQVTPLEKEGAEEPFHDTSSRIENAGALVGEDGDHFAFDGQFVHWGSGGAPYFFARQESPQGAHWQMSSGTPQPEAGIDIHYRPELYSPDLDKFAFAAGWRASEGVESKDLEFKAGPPGGPYGLAAALPRGQIEFEKGVNIASKQGGWVAATPDFSKLLFRTLSRTLAGSKTATSSGYDLYEYSAGSFHQVNVATAGATIGHCGAEVARGTAEPQVTESIATRHSLSTDGSRLFFYAAPGATCPSEKEWALGGPNVHLYLRSWGPAGAQTTDLGAVSFQAANASGSRALLKVNTGAVSEFRLYDSESGDSRLLFTKGFESEGALLFGALPPHVFASADLSTIYLTSRLHLTPDAPPVSVLGSESSYLYRYDLSTETMRFVLVGASPVYLSPDGRYAYMYGSGLPESIPGAGVRPKQEQFKSKAEGIGGNVLRYDAFDNLIQCLSCASGFNPDPEAHSNFIQFPTQAEVLDEGPEEAVASPDGDFVFFQTYAALLPADANGELSPASQVENAAEDKTFGPSDDVYEWRAPGVDACARPQGCLALISSGGAGRIVALLGTAHEGRDVFFTSAAPLGPNDADHSLDVYDARIGGGESALPGRPVECEGDSCANPPPPPNDATPGSLTYRGPGDQRRHGARHHRRRRHHHKRHRRGHHKRHRRRLAAPADQGGRK